MEQVSFNTRRTEFIHRLEGQYLKYDETVEMMKNFVKLFVIDEGAVQSVSTDQWSKKINRALQNRDIERRKAKGEVITSSKTAVMAQKANSQKRRESM